MVIKPRHGAGSQQTFLVCDQNDLDSTRDRIIDANNQRSFIQQAYLPGLSCSVAAIVANRRLQIEVFPPGLQRLSDDGRFRYLGGRIPIQGHGLTEIEQLVRRTCQCIPGLCGYVGFDIVLPTEAVDHPLLVEVNPRLTTSYIGYRSLTVENLAERILYPQRDFPPIDWKKQAVSFSTDGTVRIYPEMRLRF